MKKTFYLFSTLVAVAVFSAAAADDDRYANYDSDDVDEPTIHFCPKEHYVINLDEIHLNLFWVESAFTRTQQLAEYFNKEQRDRLSKVVKDVSSSNFEVTKVEMLQINSRDRLTYGRYPVVAQGLEKKGSAEKTGHFSEEERPESSLSETEQKRLSDKAKNLKETEPQNFLISLKERRRLEEQQQLSAETQQRSLKHELSERHFKKQAEQSVPRNPSANDFKDLVNQKYTTQSYVPNATMDSSFSVKNLFYQSLAPIMSVEEIFFHSRNFIRPQSLPILVIFADQEPPECDHAYYDPDTKRRLICIRRGALDFGLVKRILGRRNMGLLILTTSEEAKLYFDSEFEKEKRYVPIESLDFLYETVVVPGFDDKAAAAHSDITDRVISIIKSRVLSFACQRHVHYERHFEKVFSNRRIAARGDEHNHIW